MEEIIVGGRRVGNTTRMIDRSIQILFEKGAVQIRDHHLNGNNKLTNSLMFKKVVDRLHNEHQHLFNSNSIVISRDRNIIELV